MVPTVVHPPVGEQLRVCGAAPLTEMVKLRVSAELIPQIGERIRKAAGLVSSRLGYRS